MPRTEESRSAWNSPWRGSSPGRSAAGSRHDSGTTTAAARIAIRAPASPSSSSRRAPATRSLRSPHCQMQRPAAVASVTSERTETTTRWRRSPTRPAEQHHADPGGQRDHGREPRVVDLGGGEAHLSPPARSGAYPVQPGRRSAPREQSGTARLRARGHGGDLVLHGGLAAAQDQPGVQGQGDDAGDERRQHRRVAQARSRASRRSRRAGCASCAGRGGSRRRPPTRPRRRPRRRRRSSPGRPRSGCRTRR